MQTLPAAVAGSDASSAATYHGVTLYITRRTAGGRRALTAGGGVMLSLFRDATLYALRIPPHTAPCRRLTTLPACLRISPYAATCPIHTDTRVDYHTYCYLRFAGHLLFCCRTVNIFSSPSVRSVVSQLHVYNMQHLLFLVCSSSGRHSRLHLLYRLGIDDLYGRPPGRPDLAMAQPVTLQRGRSGTAGGMWRRKSAT